MDVLLTYDVSDKQSEVKKELRALGYLSKFTFDGKTIYLPNTTVWKKDTGDFNKAISDIQTIAGFLNIKLERAIAVPWGYDWQSIIGYPPK